MWQSGCAASASRSATSAEWAPTAWDSICSTSWTPKASTAATSLSTDGSDPLIEYFRRGSAASHLGLADHPLAYCAASRHLHLTGISPALSDGMRELVFAMAAQARQAGQGISFDPNLRPRLWPSQQVMVDTM